MDKIKMDLNFGPGEKVLLVLLSCVFAFFRFSFPIALFLSSFCIIAFVAYLKYQYGYFERLGIPGPPPSLFQGNLGEFKEKGAFGCDMEWVKEYGKIYGDFNGSQPDLVIHDTGILRQILVKDFSNFMDRRQLQNIRGEDSIFSQTILALRGQKWKDVRSTVTPAFTAGKMKQMIYLIKESLETLDEILDDLADKGESLNLKKVMGNLTMDVIGSVAFGMKVDAQRDPNNAFIKYAIKVFSLSLRNFSVLFAISFPWTVKRLNNWFGIRVLQPDVENFFNEAMSKIIQERKKNPRNGKPDFLDLLLKTTETKEMEAEKDSELGEAGGKRIRLTDSELVAQSFIFLVAGYHTTATTLDFLLYSLAMHPEAQEKSLQELEQVLDGRTEVSYEDLNRMQYLEAAMMETLRMFPPAVRVDRHTISDYEIDGLKIPGGTTVSVPVYAIHHSEENYESPEEFRPERFLGEEKSRRDPLTFLPFGYGPRNCIGMRFAQMEIKLALAKILPKYRFLPNDKTERPPLKLSPMGLLHSEEPIQIDVQRRT